jgi:hypothetical protein
MPGNWWDDAEVVQPATGGAGGGKLKTNYAMTADGVAAPIPGTPEAEKARLAQAARAAELRSMQRVADQAGRLIPRAVDGMEAFTSWVQPTTGVFGKIMSNIPGTAAYNFDRDLDTVKSNIGFDRLQQMRNQSPTGGAVGQVSDTENRLLQSTLASLDPGQDADQVKANLGRIRDEYALRLREAGGGMPARAPARAAPAKPKVVRFEDLP